MSRFDASHFFDLTGFEHAAVFASGEPVWTALGEALQRYLAAYTGWTGRAGVPPGVWVLGEQIALAPSARIEPGAVLVGPAIIGPDVQVRTGAYVREHVILGAGAIVGAHTEVKGSILLPHAKAPHQAYVGDSVLGREVNLGAGTILSNVKNVGKDVSFRHDGETFHTGLHKFGAVLGDGCKTGCNTVLNPGVLMGPGCVTYPNATLRGGYYRPHTLVKVRQQQQIVELERLRRE